MVEKQIIFLVRFLINDSRQTASNILDNSSNSNVSISPWRIISKQHFVHICKKNHMHFLQPM